MTPYRSPEDDGEQPATGSTESARNVDMHAWASEHGSVHQSAENMIVVHGDLIRIHHLHRHQHFHPDDGGGAEEAVERGTVPAGGEGVPYPGMRAFGRADAEWFFGRRTLLSRLFDRLEKCLDDHRPLAVVAPSGAGKSSLLRAGLLPELAKGQLPGAERWPQLLLTPTAAPLAALTTGLALLTGAEEAVVGAAVESGPGSVVRLVRERLALPTEAHVLLVVDQLEELFTLCQDESVRRRFVAVLAALTAADGSHAPVALTVYGLRADVYGSCVAHPHLHDALQNRQLIVGPMTDKDVRDAVTLPARRAGLRLGPGLVDAVLRDLRGTVGRPVGDDDARAASDTTSSTGTAAYEAGRLPLLAHALRKTWLNRVGDTLTVGTYRETGGIDGAVADTAETEFKSLSPADRRTARQLFLSLVRIGDGGEAVRRPRTRADLLLTTTDPRAVPGLVERFTLARLLTQGRGPERATVEVTHEVLLTAWPRLHGWIAAAGQGGVPIRQELEEAAVAWDNGGRKDTASLYRGARLELARSWAADDRDEDLVEVVADFLDVSGRYERRSRLLRRGAVAVITVLALLASGLAVFALDSRADALKQRDNAVFDRVTAEADRQRDTNGALAAQLDLVAYRMRPTAALRTRLMQEAGAVMPTRLPGDFGAVHSVSFGAKGRLATGGDALRFWNAADPTRPAPLASPVAGRAGTRVSSVYSPKRGLLAVGGGDGAMRIFDVSDGAHPVPLSDWIQVSTGSLPILRFSPDGRTLAFVSTVQSGGAMMSGEVQLWSVVEPRRPRRLSSIASVPGQSASSLSFSRDGTLLAICGGTTPGTERVQRLRLMDVSDPGRPKAVGGELGSHSTVVNHVAFSPVGPVLASAGSDNKVVVWDLSQPRRPKVASQLFLSSPATSVEFSPDGRLLATGENSGSVYLWNVGAPGTTRTLGPALQGHTANITALSFDSTGRTLASGGGDGRILLWRLPPTLAVTTGGYAAEVVSPTDDGRLLAVASGPSVTLWDISDPSRLTQVGRLPDARTSVNALAFRPGRTGQRLLAVGDFGGGIRLWNVSAPARPLEAGAVRPGVGIPVGGLAFDASGHTLLAGALQLQSGFSGSLHAWDVSDPARPTPLGDGPLGGYLLPVRAVAAAPRGGYVYTGEVYGGNLRVWRTADGTVPTETGRISTGQIVITLAADTRTRVVATGNGDSSVRLWNMSRPTAPTPLGKPLLTGGIVNSLDFAPSGGLLASGNGIGQIRLWDTTDPAHATAYGLPVTGHGGLVSALEFSPRAGTLITGGADGTVRLWQTDPTTARTLLCASTSSAMTPAQWRKYVSPDLPYDPPCPK
ncbi:NACHT and WD repeat domain-containing protein [Streptomyces adonidis]|uniref:NACHT and WD repeat domain-containing protein n=1 Tax=Streptomyces adonidis TaxID=3231367 RepID=UPI0034DB3034